MKIGITGAEGTIGSVLRKGLSNKYKIIAFTLQTQDFESIQIDLSNNNEITPHFHVIFHVDVPEGPLPERLLNIQLFFIIKLHSAQSPTLLLLLLLPILIKTCVWPTWAQSW